MKEIRTAGIIGAGALGLLYLEQIEAQVKDNAIFIASDNRRNLINNTTYSINGNSKQFKAVNPIDSDIQPDLIILAVKNYHLQDTFPLLLSATGPDTVILSLLNGISSESILKEACPGSEVLYAAALGMDAVKEGNALNYTSRGKIIIGTENNAETDALIACCHFFEQCGINYTVPEDIHRELWYKWMINIGVNQISAVCGAPYGKFRTDPVLRDLMNRAMLETVALAKIEEIDLDKSSLEQWYKILETLGADGKTSMLQDMEARRQTEVDSFAGELIQRAKKHGLTVPVNETLYAIIKTKEDLQKAE
jgi:2-dehydropantoate 2-reductase